MLRDIPLAGIRIAAEKNPGSADCDESEKREQ